MKHTKKGPCEHYDMEADKPRPTCIQDLAKSEGEGCFYWMESFAVEDPHEACKRRYDIPEDIQTVDIFEEGN